MDGQIGIWLLCALTAPVEFLVLVFVKRRARFLSVGWRFGNEIFCGIRGVG